MGVLTEWVLPAALAVHVALVLAFVSTPAGSRVERGYLAAASAVPAVLAVYVAAGGGSPTYGLYWVALTGFWAERLAAVLNPSLYDDRAWPRRRSRRVAG